MISEPQNFSSSKNNSSRSVNNVKRVKIQQEETLAMEPQILYYLKTAVSKRPINIKKPYLYFYFYFNHCFRQPFHELRRDISTKSY
uniref:Uncharacterized protein n=1 Tax=Pyxicephalus adspersus TaxID=30357 RepID=A0AAV3A9Z1_PYXAD|nr:TPA: hypothetical protein GDO54_014207 [Pyxicephalus adspersus]